MFDLHIHEIFLLFIPQEVMYLVLGFVEA